MLEGIIHTSAASGSALQICDAHSHRYPNVWKNGQIIQYCPWNIFGHPSSCLKWKVAGRSPEIGPVQGKSLWYQGAGGQEILARSCKLRHQPSQYSTHICFLGPYLAVPFWAHGWNHLSLYDYLIYLQVGMCNILYYYIYNIQTSNEAAMQPTIWSFHFPLCLIVCSAFFFKVWQTNMCE